MRFADTSFWYALQVRRDHHHAEASGLAHDEHSAVVTSNHVVGETWTLLRRRAGHAAAVGFLERLARLPNLEVAHVDAEIEDDAWRWLRRHDDREFSFVDATSFALMRRRRIREALAFDGDFHAAGFIELRP
ncbi:MAG: type II toxin-antitoxin system VapC family toxin [Streptosporangiales bacterium]